MFCFCSKQTERPKEMLAQEPAATPDLVMTLLPGEIAHAHIAMMRAAGLANGLLDRATASNDPDTRSKAGRAALGLAHVSARMMQVFMDGILVLDRLEGQPDAPALRPTEAPATARGASAPLRPRLHAAPGQPRGRLNNANPSGDYLAAPRCGARARSGGSCRQPAMKNGRCRFHGGKSTGARTPQGLARCRAARLVHGGRTARVIAFRSAACHGARRLRRLTGMARRGSFIGPRPAGHGVDRSDFISAARHPRLHHMAERVVSPP
jgi:hypothetical protein